MKFKLLNWLTGILLTVLLSSCGGGGNVNSGGTQSASRSVAWVDNAWTQPVPEWGSPVRLNLPVPLDSIVFGPGGGIGAFGAHEGGHVEGLNHIWIPILPNTPVRSWASGTVRHILFMDASMR